MGINPIQLFNKSHPKRKNIKKLMLCLQEEFFYQI